MTYGDILLEKRGGVATITINRPQVHNAFRLQTIEEMIHAFLDVEADAESGVAVVTGTGTKAFSTGGDVDFEGDLTPAIGRQLARQLVTLSAVMRGLGKPIIAKVRGWCVGGGNELNLLCDLTVASEDARFGQVGPKMGSTPIWFGTQMLPRLLGEKKAREVVFLCRSYSAEEAERLGWINKVVPENQLDQEVEAWCQRILEFSPQALRLAKVSMNYESDQLLAGVHHSFEILTQMYGTAEFKEGTRAFVEKRKPNFGKFRNV